MSSNLTAEAVIQEAREHEQRYEWLDAAKSYERVLDFEAVTETFVADNWQKIGFCYSLASRQADDVDVFREIRQLSVDAYRHAAELFEKSSDMKNQGRSAQCIAISEYLRSWLAPNSSDKINILDECRTFGKKALELFQNSGDSLSYAQTCSSLMKCIFDRLYITDSVDEKISITQEALDCGDRAISNLMNLGDKEELVLAYSLASLQNWYMAGIIQHPETRKSLELKSLDYSAKAITLTKEINNPYHASMALWSAIITNLLITGKIFDSLRYSEEMLKQGIAVDDNYIKGVASYLHSFATDWMVPREANPDTMKERCRETIKYATEAINYLQLVSQDHFIAETYLFYTQSYSTLASEAGLEEKFDLSTQVVQVSRDGLEYAIRSGSPDAMGSMLHAISKALYFHSKLETVKDEKVKLLEEAFKYRREYIDTVERSYSTNSWIIGVGKYYSALITKEITRLETNEENRKELLKSTISDMEEGILQCNRWIFARPTPSLIVFVAGYESNFGNMLNDLYDLNKDNELLKRAIKTYLEAAEKFKKVDIPSRVAESYWKVAINQDRLGLNQEATRSFEEAFTHYRTAAHKIPQFIDFYLDYSLYMKAWSELEKAKYAHKNENYTVAMQHYENTANVLSQSKFWSYLSPNFKAWSLLESAEDLSRKEKNTESLQVFTKASELFKEAQESFEDEINKITVQDEKVKAMELWRASIRRREYCLARSNVEQARIFDLEGKYFESAESYDLAATTFEKILETNEIDSERQDMLTIAYMCRAWQKMKMGDARDIPDLYNEASDLFLKAKESSTNYKTTLLASGNESLCKALEFGTKFEATRDQNDFAQAKRFLVTASNYYLKGGFQKTSLWISATGVVFDAYMYMGQAEIEFDPDKRMKTYLIAERCLEQASRLYETAGYIGKRDEVLMVYNNLKQQRQFTMSLGQILATPAEASSTLMISAPTLTIEEPYGVQKFEGALIEAHLSTNKKELLVGEELRLELDLANLGRETAFLNMLEEINLEEFDLVERPQRSVVVNGSLQFRGKRLSALETDEMIFRFKPKKEGTYSFRPKIQYMNEAGEYQYCETEQIEITITQLGIRGWLLGRR